MPKRVIVKRDKKGFVVQSRVDIDSCAHNVGDKDCDGCKDGQGRSRQEYCERVLSLVIKDGKQKGKKRQCDGLVHVSRFYHGDRAYWIEVISVCHKCGEIKDHGE